jgi:flagellar hook-basal body complex protein FliE
MADGFSVGAIGPKRIEVNPGLAKPQAPGAADGAKSFKDTLSEAVGEVQRLQSEADSTVKKLVSGEIKDVTDAMVAVEKADIAFQSMTAVRNKIVAAYEEIMRMQV